MSDTDYDELPSLPRGRARSRTGAFSTGPEKRYGRKATRILGGGSAHTGLSEAGTVRRKATLDERETLTTGTLGSKRGATDQAMSSERRPRRRTAEYGVVQDREGEAAVGANDDEVGLGVIPGGLRRNKKRTAKSRRVTFASDLVQTQGEGSDRSINPSSTLSAPSSGERLLRGALRAATALTSAVSRRIGELRERSPAPASPMNALQDKSNLTADSPRAPIRTRARSSDRQGVRPPRSPQSSVSRAAGHSGFGLKVFRDPPNEGDRTHVAAEAADRAAQLAPSRHPGLRQRTPSAASKAHITVEISPRPHKMHRKSLRSLGPSNHGVRPSHALQASPRAPRRTSPARLMVPGSSRDSLGPLALPAPWNIVPPGPDKSSSPDVRPATDSGLVFRFTTTEFDDLPSLRLSLDGSLHRSNQTARFSELQDGAGMDSSIELETWDDETNGVHTSPTVREHPAVNVVHREAGKIADEGRIAALEEREPKSQEMEQAPAQLDPTKVEVAPLPQVAIAIPSEVPDDEDAIFVEPLVIDEPNVAYEAGDEQMGAFEDEDETLAAVSLEASLSAGAPGDIVTPTLLQAGAAATCAPGLTEEGIDSLHQLSPTPSASTSPCRAVFFSATSMPPRRIRPSIDSPRPDGPPSDEDPLGYYLRTTGTFSSEDDLPSSAPSDDSALEDYLAEREVGRAVKPASYQRDKRIAAGQTARHLRLEARKRDGLQRRVLDIDAVRLSKEIKAAIDAHAEGQAATEQSEIHEALRNLKARWRAAA